MPADLTGKTNEEYAAEKRALIAQHEQFNRENLATIEKNEATIATLSQPPVSQNHENTIASLNESNSSLRSLIEDNKRLIQKSRQQIETALSLNAPENAPFGLPDANSTTTTPLVPLEPAEPTPECNMSPGCYALYDKAKDAYKTWTEAKQPPTPYPHKLAQDAKRTHDNYINGVHYAAAQAYKVNDDCEQSRSISVDGKKVRPTSCKATDTYIDATKVTQTASEMAGSTALNVVGSTATSKAQNSGKLSDTYDGAADSYSLATKLKVTQGSISTVAAAYIGYRGSSHLHSAGQLDKLKKEQEALKNTGSPDERVKAADLAAKAARAAQEQREKGTQAQAVALAQAVRAAQQFTEAGIAEQGRKDNRKLARDARKGENLAANTFDNVPPLAPDTAEAVTAGQSNALSGSATAEIAADTAEEVVDDYKGLGDSGNPNAGGDQLAGTPPQPSGFTGGGGGPSGGGGGGGGFSGGSTSASQPEKNAEGSATMAEKITNPNKYGVGGSGGYGAANAGKGGGANNGPDLSGLLASLLPKEEKEAGPRNGILDYGDGRAPASEAPFSPLSRDADIFKVVHDAYQDKHRRGAVGL